MCYIQNESRRSDFFCLSVKCEASFTICQLPKSLAATNWPIFRISASIYVNIVVLFDAKNWLEFTAIKPLWLAPQNAENRFPEVQNFQIFRGRMPPDPPRYSSIQRAFISWRTHPFKPTVSTLCRGSCFRVFKCSKNIRRQKIGFVNWFSFESHKRQRSCVFLTSKD